MRILWAHEVSYLGKPVYEYQDFAERLAGRGHNVRVVDFDEQGAGASSAQGMVTRTGEGEVELTTLPHVNAPILRYLTARLNHRRFLSEALDAGAIDAALVYSVFINGADTIRLCRRYGVPVVYRVLDAYHRLRPGRLIQATLRRGERYVYRNADRILVTNEKMADYVSDVANRDVSGKLEVVDHGVDTRHFSPRARDPVLAKELGIADEDPVALFLGTTYPFSGLDGLVQRMPGLMERMPRLKLIVMGAGELDSQLRKLIERHRLQDHVHCVGMIQYTDLPRYLSLGTVGINPFRINEITRDIVPIKILQYLASGLPTLSTPLPDLQRKFEEGHSGLCYSESDRPDAFADALLASLADRRRLEEQRAAGLRFVAQHHSVDRAMDRLEGTFEELRRARA